MESNLALGTHVVLFVTQQKFSVKILTGHKYTKVWFVIYINFKKFWTIKFPDKKVPTTFQIPDKFQTKFRTK